MDITSEVQIPTLRPASCAEPPGCLALRDPAGLPVHTEARRRGSFLILLMHSGFL